VNDPADEPPVLKIRRDAEKDVRYHYDRDERLALKGPLRQQGRSGCLGRIFRTGGRSLLPALLVVLAVVLVVLIVRLVSRDRATGHLVGYDVHLRAYPYQDALLASVTVTWNPLPAERAAVATEATVRFSTSAAGAGSVVIEALGSGETVARGRLPYTGTERQVDAEVTIGDGAVRLAADLGKP
jgi:hypothetical protein